MELNKSKIALKNKYISKGMGKNHASVIKEPFHAEIWLFHKICVGFGKLNIYNNVKIT